MKAISHRIAALTLILAGMTPSLLQAQVKIGTGHVDIGIAYEEGHLHLHIHDETVDAEHEPDEAALVVRHPARTAVPADARFSFLGSPGSPLWVLPQVENEQLLFLGIGAEETEAGAFAIGQLRLTLKQVQGPGHFFVYSASGVTGAPTVAMNTQDGIADGADFALVSAGGHADYNWAFTAPGAYAITFEASGVLQNGGVSVSSGPVTFAFQVEAQPGSQGDIVMLYAGVDTLPSVRFGTYAGLPNPNLGRLSLLYAHTFPDNILNNHYHAIGAYEYAGPTNAPVVIPTNANNRLPETFTLQAPITLVPGSGLYAGALASAKTGEPYSDLRIRSAQTLRRQITLTVTNEYGFGSPQYALFYSSLGGRTSRLDHAVVALELVAKSPDLRIGTAFQKEVLSQPGDRVIMGEGNSFEFEPVIWTEAGAPTGAYYVRFKLVDVSDAPGHVKIPESGIFTVDFQVAPPPMLEIARTVTLTLPLATEGHALEASPAVNGPWGEMDVSFEILREGEGESARITGKKVTLPLASPEKFFRLRKL